MPATSTDKGPRYYVHRCFLCDRTCREVPVLTNSFRFGRRMSAFYLCVECQFGEKVMDHPNIRKFVNKQELLKNRSKKIKEIQKKKEKKVKVKRSGDESSGKSKDGSDEF